MVMFISRIYVIVGIRCLDLETCNGDVNDDPFKILKVLKAKINLRITSKELLR